MRRTVIRSALAVVMLCILNHAAVRAQDSSSEKVSSEKDSSEKEIEHYRAMISDPMSNPGYLAVDRGEILWAEKRGSNNVSLEGCDLGLGAGKLEGAYA